MALRADGGAEDREPLLHALGEMVALPFLRFVEAPVVVEVL
jgi:hypothetical protein